MGGCTPYIQLFCGWLILNFATFFMGVVPHSVRLLGFRANLDESDKFVVFGLWVLVEITVFFILLVSATVIMCTFEKVPEGPGFIHLVVDPVFITLICIPLILIKSVPKSAAAHSCMYAKESQILSQNTLVNNGHSYTLLEKRVNCLANVFSDTHGNVTMNLKDEKILENELHHYMDSWVVMLQCALPVSVVLKLVRFRWKMSWQPVLHSCLFIFLQSLDMSFLIGLAIRSSQYWWNLALQLFIYINTVILCISCLGISSPPAYIGNHLSPKYIKVLTYMGIISFDVPFLILRSFVLYETWNAPLEFPAAVDGPFYLMILKECILIGGIFCIIFERISRYVGSTYLSLNTHDSECEEYDMDDFEYPVDPGKNAMTYD